MKLSTPLRTLGLAVAGLVGAASLASAQALNGLHSSTPGARANGMGGTFIAIADDASAAVSNPAGLTNLTRPQVYGEITSAKNGVDATGLTAEESRVTSFSFASVSAPVNDKVTVGASYNEFFKISATNGTEEFTATGKSYGVSVAARASSTVKVGATVTADHISATDSLLTANNLSNSGVGIELGGLWQAAEKLSVGAAASYGSDDAGNVRRIGGGVAYRATDQLLVSADLVHIGSGFDIVETHVGGEYAIPQESGTLFLRAGGYVATNDPDSEDRGATFGAGFAAKQKFQVDLAFATKHTRVVLSAGVRF